MRRAHVMRTVNGGFCVVNCVNKIGDIRVTNNPFRILSESSPILSAEWAVYREQRIGG